MKNPFKVKNITDTLVNVGVGGAANVAMDYAFGKISFLSELDSTAKNAVKIVAGAIVGSMFGNKYAKAAFDGIATVGVSNLIGSYLNEEEKEEAASPSGLPEGMIGRAPRSLGQRGFARRYPVSGVSTPNALMGK